jgi:hypothetical protein
MGINTEDRGVTAKQAKYQFLSVDNALYCEDCFFYAGATLNVNINVCAISYTGGYTKFYDANLPADVAQKMFGYYWSSSCASGDNSCTGFSSNADARAKTDCFRLPDVVAPTAFDCEILQL